MTHGRVIPWKDKSELEELKSWFYPKDSEKGTEGDRRKEAILRVKGYKLKGSQYLPHVIDSTAQLTSAMVADEEAKGTSDELYNLINMRMTYTMILIRFVNGLLDPSQQTQFAIPLHTIARRVGLPSWFVDLRHWGTHERDLPSIDMLRMAAKEAMVWLWDNYWDNDELDEEDDDDDDEDTSVSERSIEEQRINDLRKLIRNWRNKEDELEEYSYMWKQEGSAVITSTNFTVSDRDKKNSLESNSIPDLIEKYTALFKQIWRGLKNRSSFIKVIIESYNKMLLGFLLQKLPNFDIELITWILDTTDQIYLNENKVQEDHSLLLTTKFPKWKKLEATLLHTIVKELNIKKRLDDIKHCLDRHTLITYPRSRLYYLLSENIEVELNNNNWRKKKRRKDVNDSSKALLELSEEWKTLNKDFILSHDTLEEEKKYNSWRKIPTKANKVQKKTSDNDINNDLQTLRERLQKLKQKKQETDVMKLKAFNWEQHDEWEPKPIGIL
ncbi:Protein LAS1 [Nakaseomyces bracarensis]|uniref:Protein LAS1 n=1 Tax=Nakaseomyces bracarensis TaxID=273131 RepID=A0ABR4NM78_9SACH